MKQLGILCTLALFLLVIAPVRGYSQDNDNNKTKAQDDAKPQQDRGQENDRARQDPRQDQRAQQNDRARQDQRAQQRNDNNQANENRRSQQEQDRNTREQDRNAREQDRNQHPMNNRNDNRPVDNRQDNRRMENRPAENRQDMGRDQNRRAADRGRRIPDDQFRTHFGREHRFHVRRDEIVNVQQPIVVYGGYSWELAEPWPSDWSYDDDCYIDEVNDEYFLFDVMHPGMQIAVFLVQ